MYAEYLAWRGVAVREVDTAAAARHAMAFERPDALVTDERLPDSTGFALLRAVRSCEHTFDLPVVLLCSDSFGNGTRAVRRDERDRVLVVPVLPEALYRQLEMAVQACAAARPSRRFESWLFLRGSKSVWLVRTGALEVVEAGPGRRRNIVAFGTEPQLLAFQADRAQRLRQAGYALALVGRDRRSGADRRRVQRAESADRRALQ